VVPIVLLVSAFKFTDYYPERVWAQAQRAEQNPDLPRRLEQHKMWCLPTKPAGGRKLICAGENPKAVVVEVVADKQLRFVKSLRPLTWGPVGDHTLRAMVNVRRVCERLARPQMATHLAVTCGNV
jgi:hypothetical protein